MTTLSQLMSESATLTPEALSARFVTTDDALWSVEHGGERLCVKVYADNTWQQVTRSLERTFADQAAVEAARDSLTVPLDLAALERDGWQSVE